MMLHILECELNVTFGIGLMPTIERMEISPQGQKMSFHFSNSILLIAALFYLLSQGSTCDLARKYCYKITSFKKFFKKNPNNSMVIPAESCLPTPIRDRVVKVSNAIIMFTIAILLTIDLDFNYFCQRTPL